MTKMAFAPSQPLLSRPTQTTSICRHPSPKLAKPPCVTRMVAEATTDAAAKPFSPAGMTVDDFFSRSMGDWFSQRSSHNLIWKQFEAITSEIQIREVSPGTPDLQALCTQNSVSEEDIAIGLKMDWEGESDWDDEEVLAGSATMAVIKDEPTRGRLLRSVGYAETIPAVGDWEMTDEGVFVLKTFYEAAAAEERIWFATPDLRMRVSQIRTSSGTGVVTASFSTEVRKLKLDDES